MTGPVHSHVDPNPQSSLDSGGTGEPRTPESVEAQRSAVTYWREHWRRQAVAERAALDQGEPWALPLVVRVEKTDPPTHEDAIAASALAVVRLLADPDSAPGGQWHADLERWTDGRIRKVVRRARGVRWPEVSDLPGVTVEVATAQVRALLPHPVSQAPAVVARLQVQGLDLSPRSVRALAVDAAGDADDRGNADAVDSVDSGDAVPDADVRDGEVPVDRPQSNGVPGAGGRPGEARPAEPRPAGEAPGRELARTGPRESGAPVLSIVLAPSVPMTTGKACAQVGHAAQLGMLELDQDLVLAWTEAGFPLRVVEGTPTTWARILSGTVRAALVQDAGYTEVEPGTRTCAATFG
ncbi:peptidyl-tRNA hydrolase [Actinopolymorpha pittospori]|uniref:peptidyl-tRNA hydrolase n=1 Tax=Actinopolymorpha pittospori TaxID=648752 RepID=A0A927MR56_9ACTN|nr:peptidyl-tRNA hydrolase [Actinopolymorpha pittospori]